jgi:hypothetical protein
MDLLRRKEIPTNKFYDYGKPSCVREKMGSYECSNGLDEYIVDKCYSPHNKPKITFSSQRS